MDGDNGLKVVCITCGHEVRTGQGMCFGCGTYEPTVEISGEDTVAELRGVGR